MKRLAPEAPAFEVAALKRDGTQKLAEWIAGKRDQEKRGNAN
jgi:hypothetical protein